MSDTTPPKFQIGQCVRCKPQGVTGYIYAGPHEAYGASGYYTVRFANVAASRFIYHEDALEDATPTPEDMGVTLSNATVDIVKHDAIAAITTVPIDASDGCAAIAQEGTSHITGTIDYPARLSDEIIANSKLATLAHLDRLMALLSLSVEERAFVRGALASEKDAGFWCGLVDYLLERGHDEAAEMARDAADRMRPFLQDQGAKQ